MRRRRKETRERLGRTGITVLYYVESVLSTVAISTYF